MPLHCSASTDDVLVMWCGWCGRRYKHSIDDGIDPNTRQSDDNDCNSALVMLNALNPIIAALFDGERSFIEMCIHEVILANLSQSFIHSYSQLQLSYSCGQ